MIAVDALTALAWFLWTAFMLSWLAALGQCIAADVRIARLKRKYAERAASISRAEGGPVSLGGSGAPSAPAPDCSGGNKISAAGGGKGPPAVSDAGEGRQS